MLKLRFNILCALAMTAVMVIAKPADPRPRQFVQPDGQTLSVTMHGDEHGHYYTTEDGLILTNVDDALYYADIDDKGYVKATPILAHAPYGRTTIEKDFIRTINTERIIDAANQTRIQSMSRRLPKSRSAELMGGYNFPTKGKQKALVVLVAYDDVDFSLPDPYDYFYNMLNQDGFSQYGGTGCAAQYFRDNSMGVFEPEFDVYGPVILPRERSYYGGNDASGADRNPHYMAIHACDILDEEVDFSQYDRDGDGYIDNIYIFYAGEGEATGGGANTVWPHAWNISYVLNAPQMYDGVRLDRYACSNEWDINKPDGMGTFVHEFSHVLGLPDLYATLYSTAFTPGFWDPMDVGVYNNDSRTPSYMSAYERKALGWLEPKLIEGPMNVTIEHIANNEAYMIKTSDPNEYYLFENRQKEGWDAYIPGHGMLVWHIDFNQNIWNNNTVNNNPTHQHVDLIEADGRQTQGSVAGDAFPGTANVTSFTETTSPSMTPWTRESLGLPITDIQEVDGLITFMVDGGKIEFGPISLNEPSEVRGFSFVLSWNVVDQADHYLVSVYTINPSEERVYVAGWENKDVDNVNSVLVTGLQPLTTYYCSVTPAHRKIIGDPSDVKTVTTGQATWGDLAPMALPATDVTADGFTANWESMGDNMSYIINVYTKGEPTMRFDGCDFANGVSVLPDGWTTNASVTYMSAEYTGVSAPAARLHNADIYVASPVYDKDLYSLSFWYRGSSTSPQNWLSVQGLINDKWVIIEDLEIKNEAPGENVIIEPLPAGVRSVKIVYCEGVHRGSVALDDIIVGWSSGQECFVVEGYDMLNVGNVLAWKVGPLASNDTYYYSIWATDGDSRSLMSNEVAVVLQDDSGIIGVVDDCSVSVDGRILHISGRPGSTVEIYNTVGHPISIAKINDDGYADVKLNAHGIYIVRTQSSVSKILIE